MRFNFLFPIVYYVWRHHYQNQNQTDNTEVNDIPRKSFKGV